MSSGIQGNTPSQIRQAYGFDQVVLANGVAGDGSGQTIAIVNPYDSPTIAADLHKFDEEFGIADPPTFVKVNQSGGSKLPAFDSAWAAETALDVEWAHAIAPGANIVLVEARSSTLSDLAAAIDTARHLPGVSVVSMSWGTNEFEGESAYDPLFTTPLGHTGVTFVAASGDTGSAGSAQWPATSPNVLAVGGTNLTFAGVLGTYGVETYSPSSTTATSQYELSSVAALTATGIPARTVPDVSYDASGYAVYNSAAGGWQVLSGTSAAAPQWAALIAIADQGRVLQGLNSADGATMTVPALYTGDGSAFTILTSTGGEASGSNGAASVPAPSSTGLGTPKVPVVVKVISGATATNQPVNTQYTPPGTATGGKKVKPFYTLSIPNPRPLGVTPIVFAPQRVMGTDLPARTGHSAGSAPPSSGSSAALVSASQASPARPGHAGAPRVETTALHVPQWLTHAAMAVGRVLVDAPVAAASGPIEVAAVQAPIQAVYHFAQVNALSTFSDALGLFINECATITPPDTSPAEPSHARAWAVTATVVVADIVLIHHALHRRHRKKAAARPPARASANPTWWDASEPVPSGTLSCS